MRPGRVTMLILLTIVAGLVLLVAAVGLLQRRLIYIPIGRPGPPAAAGLPTARDVAFTTGDGLELRAWLVPPEPEAAGPAPAVLFLPGNAGHRAGRAPLASALSRMGLHVLLVDYRGYAGNPGSPSEAGLAADALAAHRFLTGQPRVDPERIVIFGESLGTGVAVTLAAEVGPAALILRSPFPSLTAVARLHYPLLPVGTLLRDRFESEKRIAAIDCPLLVLAGDADGIIPVEQSRLLFEAAIDPKRFVTVPGAGHNDPALLAGPQVLESIRDFLEESGVLS